MTRGGKKKRKNKKERTACPVCGEMYINVGSHMKAHRNEQEQRQKEEEKQKRAEKRRDKKKKKVIEQLRKTPIVTVAVSRAGISTSTYYRWCSEDSGFAVSADRAKEQGELLMNDIATSQLIQKVKEKNLSAIKFWLKNKDPGFAGRTRPRSSPHSEMTAEEEKEFLKQLDRWGFSDG